MDCIQQEDLIGKDDIVIVVNEQKIWGLRCSTGQSAIIDKTFSFKNEAVIQLYEQDDFDADDFLGEYVVKPGVTPVEVSHLFTYRRAKYRLTFCLSSDVVLSQDELQAKIKRIQANHS
ncbi:MAG: hypothetical protein NZ108_08600 [Bacteroidia bacterium]|nr:hypothetical protein [Bacteroidia bacterium]